MKLQNLVNHVVFVIDESGSMQPHRNSVVSVFDDQIKFLSRRSQELNQETRVSVYKFSNETECIIYDMDVMRAPSLKGLYSPGGGTALLDASTLAVKELKLTPEIHGDHAFLFFVLTDGQEMHSYKTSRAQVKKAFDELPDNWSLGILVPDKYGSSFAEQCGFPQNNICIWEIGSTNSVAGAGNKIQAATDNFFQGRAKGVRSTKNLFQINTAIAPTKIKAALEVIPSKEYITINVRKDGPIKETVELWTKDAYRSGSGYYQLTKRETIGARKNLLVKETKTGKVYGGDAARQLLGLPDTEVKVEPAHLRGYDIYVQSTSVNRKLIAGTELIVMV